MSTVVDPQFQKDCPFPAGSLGEYFFGYLTNNGLWPKEAIPIIEGVSSGGEVLETMQGRWKDPVTAYGEPLLAVVLISIRSYAREWLEVNAPNHFAKMMFADAEEWAAWQKSQEVQEFGRELRSIQID